MKDYLQDPLRSTEQEALYRVGIMVMGLWF